MQPDMRNVMLQPDDSAESAPKNAASGKSILILDFDLYSTWGDGPSTYRKLIETFPENSYFYFAREEPVTAARPKNARTIRYRSHYHAPFHLPENLQYFYDDYLQAWQFAAAVRAELGSCNFDVVDGPDWRGTTLFIRGALAAHDIGCETVALALHGVPASALREDWSGRALNSRHLAYLRMRGHLQYRAADARYAISESYADWWAGYTGFRANVVDPLCMVSSPAPVLPKQDQGPPDLVYVGERDRWRGPDLFVDIAWCMPEQSVARVLMIGPDIPRHSKASGASRIGEIASNRGVELTIIDRLAHDGLEEICRGRSVIVAPARHEAFNLAVLEALHFGCPAFAGSGAGVARWIRTRLPELSDLVLELSCSRASVQVVRDAVVDYDRRRQRVVDILSHQKTAANVETLHRIYEPAANVDRSALYGLAAIERRFDHFSRPRELADLPIKTRVDRFARGHSSLASAMAAAEAAGKHLRPRLLVALREPRRAVGLLGAQAATRRMGLPARIVEQVKATHDIESIGSFLLTAPEATNNEVAGKIGRASAHVGRVRIGRVPVFAEIARLELKRAGDLLAAAYHLRIMRWMGGDIMGQLGFVADTLRAHGFPSEAEVAIAMFADPSLAHERCRAILDAQCRRQMQKTDLPLALLEDRRGKSEPKVAVISSLYGAESKLRTLLENIALQTLARAGRVEVILIDSNSPTQEYDVFKSFAAQHDLPIVFARSATRETIQSAWNRGIRLARAPYLCFYGADEGMHPDCLATLAAALDKNADVDWVMADSIVTNVDGAGIFKNDTMVYDRSSYEHLLVYLDTCYLNWVGGMYRRSIHDRFGYYDETFRAAGDTEFKLRIARHVRSMHIPRRLGIFNNYPEERATEHPYAEVEDLRAWYLHRMTSGVAYLFDGKPEESARALLRRALSFRRTYFRHASTDFDLAHAIAKYLTWRGDDQKFARAALGSTEAMLKRLRMVEMIGPGKSPDVNRRDLMRILSEARQGRSTDKTGLGLMALPTYEIFNDNRYEHHSGSWSR